MLDIYADIHIKQHAKTNNTTFHKYYEITGCSKREYKHGKAEEASPLDKLIFKLGRKT